MGRSITYKEYNEKYRLPEQQRDEELIMLHKHHALCYSPGKGKSYPVIHCILQINKLKNNNAKVLIMSDATCIKEMWKAEIEPQNILPKETYFVTDRTAIGQVKSALLSTKWDVIVCDECQSLRSGVTRAKSQYAKLVYQLTKNTEYVIGMTGTISGNNDIEPFCVLHNLHIAGCGDINCHAFKRNYCKMQLQYGPFGAFEKPVGLNDAGEAFMKKAYANGCSFWDYDENDEMPELDIEYEHFKVPETEEYKNALQGILKCGDNESTVQKSIAIQKAQQALNGFIYYKDYSEERQVYQVPKFDNPKLQYVLKQCKDHIAIVAYRFQEDGYYINKILNDNGIETTDSISRFKALANAGAHIILVLQCSRGKAANLQVCQHIIYYTCDYSFIAYKQMVHRTWRRGQTEKCRLTFLCNETGDKYKVEEKIWKSLKEKQTIHEALMSIKRS